MAYIGAEPLPGQNREVDDISSSFNGSTTAFTLQVNGLNVSPETANNILVNIGGVIQNPGTDYTIAASTITFTTAPAAGLSFFAIILGAGINTATVADQTIGTSKILDNAVTADKLAHTSVTAGSYTTADITVDAQGRITAAASGSISGAEIADQAITNAKINNSAAIARTKLANVDVVDDTSPQLGGDLQSNGNDIDFADNDKANFGTGNDLKIYYTGTQGRIENAAAGELRIQGDTIQITDKEANDMHIQCVHDAAVELYYDNSKKLETSNTGVTVTGRLEATSGIRGNDNVVLQLGTSNDLQIYHSGSHSYIQDAGAGSLILVGNNVTMQNAAQNENMFSATQDGAVELFHNGVSRFSTFSEGAHVHVAGNSGLRIIGTTADVNPRLVFRRKNNDANNSEPAAIQMTYVAGTTHESGHLDFLTNGDSGSAALSVKVRFQNDGVKYFDSTFDTTANNARKSYFTGTGQLVIGRNAHESYLVFQDVSNNTIGNIVRGAGASVAYNTTSDYRLKENVSGISDGITRLKQLKPSKFNFISEPSITLDGFIAHEVSSIVPEAVEGKKDGMKPLLYEQGDEIPAGKVIGDIKGYSETEPEYQGIDQSKLVPLLTAALQEAIAKIETLETKVAALEAA